MAKRPIRRVIITDIRPLTRHVRRIMLSGEALLDFPAELVGGYVKLLLGVGEDPDPLDPEEVDLKAVAKRSYTVRSFDLERASITLEFVDHAEGGPAAKWGRRVRVGDELLIAGPGPVKMLEPSVDWVFLAGDLTALAAISVNLERLPSKARGHAVVEVPAKEDRRDLAAPDGVLVHWVINPSPSVDRSPLVEKVRSLPWQEGRVGVWTASEFSTMRALRAYFKQQRQVPSDDMYISSYWKLGATDEQHKLAKKQDAG